MPLNTNQTILQKVKVDAWLRTHGKVVRPELTKQQKQELKECFELIDADGSGAIDAGELVTAFNVLGLRVRKSEIEQMLAEVDADGSGEVEYPEFVQIMTSKLDSETREDDLAKEKPKKQALPFQLLAQAYRRKKLMEAVMGGDKAAQERLTAKAEEAEVERQAVLAAMEEENQNPAVQYDQKKMRTISDLNYERIRRDQIRRKLETDSIVNLDDEMKMIITESFKSGSYEDPRNNIGEKHGNRDDGQREIHGHNKTHHWLKTELADLNEYRSRVHHKPVLEKQLLHLRAIKSIHDNAHN